MSDRPYAETMNYWKTSKGSPDSWIEKTIVLIEEFGAELISNAFGNERATGRASFLIRFKFKGQTFSIVWPVLQSEFGDDTAARRQAATMVWHDTKAKLISANVIGFRNAFMPWFEVNGVPICHADDQLIEHLPSQLRITSQPSVQNTEGQ